MADQESGDSVSNRASESEADLSQSDMNASLTMRNYVEIQSAASYISDGFPVLWGRIWDLQDSTSCVFFTESNEATLEDEEAPALKSFQTIFFDEKSNIADYDPDVAADEFRLKVFTSNLGDDGASESAPDWHEKMAEEITSFEINRLKDIIENGNHSKLEQWIMEWLDNLSPDSQPGYQIKATLVDEQFEDEIPENTSKVTETSSSSAQKKKQEQADAEEPAAESEMYNALEISVVTSPSVGIRTPYLRNGMSVLVRIIGDAVRFLPEDLVQDTRTGASSKPIEATIVSILEEPSLPKLYDADPDKYRKLRVDLGNNIAGEGLVHQDELVKTADHEVEDSKNNFRDLVYLTFAIVVIITVILIAILI